MRIAIVAGEASGDFLASGLIRAIARRHPQARFEGIGGPRMIDAGCRSLYPMERLSVMGLLETFGRHMELMPVRKRLAERFIADPPDVFVGVDAPDFNLALEARLHKAGVRTVHYASPSVWAWRRYRLRKIRRAVDVMLTLFPFEAEFFHANGVPARFVGHPLADAITEDPDRDAARARLGLPRHGELVAVLPGSRMSEVSFLAEPMVGTALWLAERRPGVAFVAPLVNAEVREYFERVLARHNAGPCFHLVDGDSRTAIAAADAVLLASGTASLETMLLKRPMVITYRMTTLTWIIANVVVDVPFVGLPNLLAGKRLVPELLQGDVVPEKLGPELLRFLEDPRRTEALLAEFRRIHAHLRNDASERAADAVLELVSRRTDDAGRRVSPAATGERQ